MSKFARPKKLVFCNNKGGVGKTTLAFNCAVNFAKKGFKTALIDLDPQCNLTLQSLGPNFYSNTLFSNSDKTIYDILKPKIEGSGDIDNGVELRKIRDNLFILPGDNQLSLFENLLLSSYNQATAGELRGYSDTSAIDRYLNEIGASESIDIFVIDTSPSLGVLNRIIFLGVDYFVVPLNPDSFSLQGIKNLGPVFEAWKKVWANTARAVAVSGNTPSNHVLKGDALFIGYVINNFTVYGKKIIKSQRDWEDNIPSEVKKFLSEKHGRNGLVEKSWRNPLGELQNYGQLALRSMDSNLAIEEFSQDMINSLPVGTTELYEKALKEINYLSDNILEVLKEY
ncbi:MAG: AAA family ATPase [Candidatus Pacebacteria bacterium]|nr:AAA family ATPase [Candidatus Paceibacterota bacterium]MDD2757528.1 AAA family ATPase [Candidatus Paceibacterota bacterium]MDD3283911.1 AAA family ATPase [Candidatus Paceibacterota bacterium]MDD3970143.1 AAA family ATPase [Candidatus Paceibacterota bacterium]MDD4738165.1 AAA family ATPase [Candidatus Paceibacterota bacterium]